MKTIYRFWSAMVIMALLPVASWAEIKDISTSLMHSTFKIEGPSHQAGRTTFGTVFLVGESIPGKPGKAIPVLVTADHVLRGIAGERAKLHLRKKIGDSQYKKFTIELQIRKKDKPLWVKHPDADVGVMYVDASHFMDIGEAIFEANLLASDAEFEEMEIHPGDELMCLGYPFGVEANPMGFPVLRSGKIASFPITPAKLIKTFLYDFEIFGGNSGGPVYFCQTGRVYGGKPHDGQTRWFIAGLITEQKSAVERRVTPIKIEKRRRRYEVEEIEEKLNLAIVVPAEFIIEAMSLLKSSKESGQQSAQRDN